MKSLSRLLTPERIVKLGSPTKEGALLKLVEAIGATTEIPSVEEVHKAIIDRENLVSTGFGHGLAIPHAKLPGIQDFTVGLGIHHDGLAFDSIDDAPVHILVMILGPTSRQEVYLQVLSRVTAFLKDNRDNVLKLDSSAAIHELTLHY